MVTILRSVTASAACFACACWTHEPKKLSEPQAARSRGAIDVVLRDRDDPRALDRLPQHLRVGRHDGKVQLSLDAPDLGDNPAPWNDQVGGVFAVLETKTRTEENELDHHRVVSEDDGVRLALWIDSNAPHTVMVEPVVLFPDAPPPAGVWLEPGAYINEGGPTPDSGSLDRPAHVVDKRIEPGSMSNMVAARAFGHVWNGPRPRDGAIAAGERRVLRADTAILAEPAAGARSLGTALAGAIVAFVAARGDLAEIELRLPAIRIRGFVPIDALDAATLDEPKPPTPFAVDYDVPGADRFFVETGTCLYDRSGGDVIGIATSSATRFGMLDRTGREWHRVYVKTEWTIVVATVHDLARASEPLHARWEPCDPPTSR
jgi:hypothetical protein